MASDSQDVSHHKHRRSPSDDESLEHSKRHKHRHHHRHHRHRRHHRHSSSSGSKKHDEDKKDEVEERNGNGQKIREVQEEQVVVETVNLVVVDKTRADYDMEEGEIIEDEELYAGNVEIGNKIVSSDVESGEIAAMGAPIEFGNSDKKCATAEGSSGVRDDVNLKSKGIDGRKSDLLVNLTSDISDNKKTLSHMESNVNGDVGRSRSHGRSCPSSKGSDKQSGQSDTEGEEGSLELMEFDIDEPGKSKRSSYPYEISRQRIHDDACDKNSSKSAEHNGGRSHSQRIVREANSRNGQYHEGDGSPYDNGKADNDLDAVPPTKFHRHGSWDLLRDKEREISGNSRYTRREGRHYDLETWDREQEEKICRDMKRDKEEEHQRRDKDWEREKEHHKERGREREQERSREKVREKDRELHKDREKARERSRDVVRDRENDRERQRNRGRSLERDYERKQRDSSKASHRDKYNEREQEERERERERAGSRVRDRHLDREDNSGRDRHGYKIRDAESNRNSRYLKYDDHDGGSGDQERRRESKHRIHSEMDYHRSRGRERHDSEKDHGPRDDSRRGSESKLDRDEDNQEEYEERVELKLAEQEEEDLNRIKEESRRRREAILQKYKPQQLQQQGQPQLEDVAKVLDKAPMDSPFQSLASEDALPQNLEVKGDDQDAYTVDPSFSVGKSPLQNDASAVEKSSGARGLGEGTPKSERSTDMFCDDIFGDSPAGVRKLGKGDGLPVESSGLHDNWDDPEGYYSYRFGEVLDGRYEITAAHGKGVFSTVVRAKDLKAGSGDPDTVAVKIIRNNETMLKAGMEELVILKKLVGADPDNRRHCVRFLSSFKYRNHLCLVFESLDMNLREVLKKFGRNIGLKLTAVRAYAKQLFIALKHLRNCGVLHCDIKPDNMLVNDAKNVLKLCDFGNAMFAGKNEITPYLVSRFYRAPEIILGLPYDHPMDMWSVGCCLYELYTGKVLFPGPTNNDMLRLHMELKGPFPKKMLRKGAFTDQHFDQDLNFLATEEDPVTKKMIKRLIVNIKPKDIAAIIKGSPGDDPKMLANFKDLLDKIFVLDPDKRLTVSQALNHPFITGK
ncbi:hypothetical protein Ancab_021039 [Ancistrocladus abbreviatus]